ncbi:MAG: bifunctional nuclease family protein [Planctomycetia bacterium]|nr:bifunctional nuclease family protein [Planctomycetia bacterium]
MQCTFSGCSERAVFHFSWVENRQCTKEEHRCEEHAREIISAYAPPFSEFSGLRRAVQGAQQFEIGFVVISEISDQQAVYLHEVDGPRVVPITIGIFEATSLDRRVKGYVLPRPLTHDGFAAGIRLLGGKLEDVIISRLEDFVYYADARIRNQDKLLSLDLRPSDAFTLAVLFDCPIFIADHVLAQLDEQGSIPYKPWESRSLHQRSERSQLFGVRRFIAAFRRAIARCFRRSRAS